VRVVSTFIEKLLTYVYGYKVNCDELKDVTYKRARSGMIRYVYSKDGDRLFTIRPNDFLPTLSKRSAEILHRCLPRKVGRVYVNEIPTKTVFNKHVTDADPNLLRGVEALVIYRDQLIGYGRCVVSGREMLNLNFGEAVKIRGKLI